MKQLSHTKPMYLMYIYVHFERPTKQQKREFKNNPRQPIIQ